MQGSLKYFFQKVRFGITKNFTDESFDPFSNEEQVNQVSDIAFKKSAEANFDHLENQFSTKSLDCEPSEEFVQPKCQRPALPTLLLITLITIVFVVLPVVYLLHCFDLLNCYRPQDEFHHVMTDHSHSNPREESFLDKSTDTDSSNQLYVQHKAAKEVIRPRLTTHLESGENPELPFPPVPLAVQCDKSSDALKFDCYPENGVNEESCNKRGCCWAVAEKLTLVTSNTSKILPPGRSTQDGVVGVPFCFYPSNYKGYRYLNFSETLSGSTSFLERTFKSPYPNDVQLLKMDVKYETAHRAHIKIYDPNNLRFEPPYPEVPLVEKSSPDTDYQVLIDTSRLGFKVVRRNGNSTIFDAQDIGGFIFADQFLQLSALLPTNYVYGLGEHVSSLALSTNWQVYTLFNHDQPPTENTNLYGSHPFYMAMETSGKSHGVFLLNSDPMEVILQPAPAVTFRAIGGVLDFYIFMGPNPDDVIRQYTELIGRPYMPPYWGLGFHLCRFGYKTLNKTKEIWKNTLNAGIPLDVQWNDLDYMQNANDFTYDKLKFAELPQFVNELHDLGMHYVPIIDPGVSASEKPGTYPPYDDGLHIFVRNCSNLPFIGKVWNRVSTVWPDFTNPDTVEYWTKQMRQMHNEFQFDGAWIDMNEPSNFWSGSVNGCPNTSLDHPPYVPQVNGGFLFYRTLCMSSTQYAGKHYDVHNLYGFTEAIATSFALMEIRGKRPFVISRSTFPGHGHYAGHWSGDISSSWNDMAKSIPAMLTFSMFGIPLMGADICGFNGNTTAALCQRWMQLGAFYPFSRNHNTDDGIPQDPVSLGPDVVKSARNALLIRYSLLPYLYTLFWKAHVVGDTVARPIFFEFPQDIQTYTIDTHFLWGPALMIVPILQEGKTEVSAYVPHGWWYEFHNSSVIKSSGAHYSLLAPLDVIPLLVRGGNIIPMQSPNLTTTASRKNNIDLLVAPCQHGHAKGLLYWDDGDSLNSWENNNYSLITFTLKDNEMLSTATFWGYNKPLTLGKLVVLGVSSTVSSVFINKTAKPFSYESNKQVLIIKDLNVSLKEPISIYWK